MAKEKTLATATTKALNTMVGHLTSSNATKSDNARVYYLAVAAQFNGDDTWTPFHAARDFCVAKKWGNPTTEADMAKGTMRKTLDNYRAIHGAVTVADNMLPKVQEFWPERKTDNKTGKDVVTTLETFLSRCRTLRDGGEHVAAMPVAAIAEKSAKDRAATAKVNAAKKAANIPATSHELAKEILRLAGALVAMDVGNEAATALFLAATKAQVATTPAAPATVPTQEKADA